MSRRNMRAIFLFVLPSLQNFMLRNLKCDPERFAEKDATYARNLKEESRDIGVWRRRTPALGYSANEEKEEEEEDNIYFFNSYR